MQGYWLQKKHNPRCILFMAGWGMGPEPFLSLAPDGCDLFLCYDYRTLTLPDMNIFSGYERLELVAWSMGVWIAANLFAGREDCFARNTALGGTLQPVDDMLGIPVAAFDTTIETLDEARLAAFYSSMFDDESQASKFTDNRPSRSVSSVRDELVSLREAVQRTAPVKDIFSRKIVTMRDRIFPARNQLRAWGKQQSEQLRWPHFPFYLEECRNIFFPFSDGKLPALVDRHLSTFPAGKRRLGEGG